ncbi:hypothetical protein [Pantoea agglomerans]
MTGLKTGQAVIVRGEAGCLTLTTGG